MIRKRKLQLLVYFSTTALKNNTGFMLKVLEHILMTWPALEPEHRAFNDAVKDLQGESMVELQRLASEMPDHLLVSRTPLIHPKAINCSPAYRMSMIRSRTASMKCSLQGHWTIRDPLRTRASSSSSCTFLKTPFRPSLPPN